MSIEELRNQIEPFLNSKGYEPKSSLRSNCKSYVNTLLKFITEHGYTELSDSAISEYLKKYETTTLFGVRKLRVQEFSEYVKGARPMPLFEETRENENEQQMPQTENEAVSDMAASEENEAPAVTKKPERAKKGNREQISLYIDKDIYATLKEMASLGNTNVSDIITKLAETFVEKNREIHCENMRNIKEYQY